MHTIRHSENDKTLRKRFYWIVCPLVWIGYVAYVRLMQKQRLSDRNSFTESCMRLHA